MNYTIIGIDASLTNTGICILRPNENFLFSIQGGKRRGPERLFYFETEFQRILTEYQPTLGIIENYAFAIARSGRVYSIGELGGVLRLGMFKNKIEYYEIAPPSVKKFLTGSGRCDKNIILKEVFRKWDINVNDDNLADEIVLAKIGEAIVNSEIHRTKIEEQIIKKILKEQ